VYASEIHLYYYRFFYVVRASSSQMREQENAHKSLPTITSTPNKNLTNSTSWYSRLSAENKEEYLNKQRIARQQKKTASQKFSKVNEPSQLATQGKKHTISE
jgi:hypothetical protein